MVKTVLLELNAINFKNLSTQVYLIIKLRWVDINAKMWQVSDWVLNPMSNTPYLVEMSNFQQLYNGNITASTPFHKITKNDKMANKLSSSEFWMNFSEILLLERQILEKLSSSEGDVSIRSEGLRLRRSWRHRLRLDNSSKPSPFRLPDYQMVTGGQIWYQPRTAAGHSPFAAKHFLHKDWAEAEMTKTHIS